MNEWMRCTTCSTVVRSNPIGICLDCQLGFGGLLREDNLEFPKEPCADYFPAQDYEKWKEAAERKNAIEERLEQIDHQQEHP